MNRFDDQQAGFTGKGIGSLAAQLSGQITTESIAVEITECFAGLDHLVSGHISGYYWLQTWQNGFDLRLFFLRPVSGMPKHTRL